MNDDFSQWALKLALRQEAAIKERDAAIRERDEALARAEKAEARERESGRQVVDGISAMLTIANQRDAAIRERDEALEILRDIVDGAKEGDTDMLETAIDHGRRMLARV